jgi:predicted  nucleic acid-binding Zn-ribbon protein
VSAGQEGLKNDVSAVKNDFEDKIQNSISAVKDDIIAVGTKINACEEELRKEISVIHEKIKPRQVDATTSLTLAGYPD